MDIFSNSQTNAGENTNGNTGGDNQTSYLDRVVAAKGENWRDVETLAKGKWESDAYIEQLEREMESLRGEAQKATTVESLLEALKGGATGATNVTPQNTNGGGTQNEQTNQPVTGEALKSLIEQTITERERNATSAQNIQSATETMVRKFGTEANSVVQKKAGELGMTTEALQSLAAQSPNAFLALMGEAPTKETGSGFVGSETRTENNNFNNNSGERNWEYYREFRRKNPTQFYTPAIQRQMFEDRMRLGDKFGNN